MTWGALIAVFLGVVVGGNMAAMAWTVIQGWFAARDLDRRLEYVERKLVQEGVREPEPQQGRRASVKIDPRLFRYRDGREQETSGGQE